MAAWSLESDAADSKLQSFSYISEKQGVERRANVALLLPGGLQHNLHLQTFGEKNQIAWKMNKEVRKTRL